MTVTLSPHAEQLVREQLARGVAQSPEEVIECGPSSAFLNHMVHARLQKHRLKPLLTFSKYSRGTH